MNIADIIDRLYAVLSPIWNSNFYVQQLQEDEHKITLFEIGGKYFITPRDIEKILKELSQSGKEPFLFIYGNEVTIVDIFGKQRISRLFEKFVENKYAVEMIKKFLENYRNVAIYNSRVWYWPVYQLVFYTKHQVINFRAPIVYYPLYYSREENHSDEFLTNIALLNLEYSIAELVYGSENHSEVDNISDAIRYLTFQNCDIIPLEGELEEEDEEELTKLKRKSKKPRISPSIPKIPSGIKIEYPQLPSIETYHPKHF